MRCPLEDIINTNPVGVAELLKKFGYTDVKVSPETLAEVYKAEGDQFLKEFTKLFGQTFERYEGATAYEIGTKTPVFLSFSGDETEAEREVKFGGIFKKAASFFRSKKGIKDTENLPVKDSGKILGIDKTYAIMIAIILVLLIIIFIVNYFVKRKKKI